MPVLDLYKTGDGDYPKYIRMLVIGTPHSGRTTLVSTAPNVLIAACEAGLMAVAHKNLPYVEITSSADLENLYLALRDPVLRERMAQKLHVPLIETVAIDTLDVYQELVKKEILRENYRTEMQPADWGKLKDRLAERVRAFARLPVNLIVTCHADVVTDDNSKRIYEPLLQGDIRNRIAGYVDFTVRTDRRREYQPDGTSKIVYYLQAEGDDANPHLGARAFGRVPQFCEPDFAVLHKAVYAGADILPATEHVPFEIAPLEQPAQQQAETPATPPSQPRPTGTPADDNGNPINKTGINAVTKAYKTRELPVPEDLVSWTMGRGRAAIRAFRAYDAQAASVKGEAPVLELEVALRELDAWTGPEKKTTDRPKDLPAAETPVEPVTPEPTEAEALSTAEAIVTETLGGTPIGQTVEAGATCAVCSKEVDNIEVAELALSRYGQVLCIPDYKAKMKEEQA